MIRIVAIPITVRNVLGCHQEFLLLEGGEWNKRRTDNSHMQNHPHRTPRTLIRYALRVTVAFKSPRHDNGARQLGINWALEPGSVKNRERVIFLHHVIASQTARACQLLMVVCTEISSVDLMTHSEVDELCAI
jgi:hypothetical protein